MKPYLEVDDDGYPDEDSLRELVTTGHWFNEVLAAAGDYFTSGYGKHLVSDGTDDLTGEPVQVHEFVTGGWSGCEQVISVLEGTIPWGVSWESSHRGGRHVLKVRAQWLRSPVELSTTVLMNERDEHRTQELQAAQARITELERVLTARQNEGAQR